MKRDDAAAKVFPGDLQRLVPVWLLIDDLMLRYKLRRDVKTIYVSYTNEAFRLVAAVHPDPASGTIELALAIPDTVGRHDLHDATHLKWRTLPVAVRVGIADFDLPRIAALISEAVESASSIVPRDPQDFIRRGQRRGVGPPRDSDGK